MYNIYNFFFNLPTVEKAEIYFWLILIVKLALGVKNLRVQIFDKKKWQENDKKRYYSMDLALNVKILITGITGELKIWY